MDRMDGYVNFTKSTNKLCITMSTKPQYDFFVQYDFQIGCVGHENFLSKTCKTCFGFRITL